MLVRHGHTYSAAAKLPAWAPLFAVRSELIDAGFTNVSVRAVDEPTYNAIGRGTWMGPDKDVDLPDEVVWIHDITPAEAPEPAPAPSPGPTVAIPEGGTEAPAPVAPTTRRRRHRAPAPEPPKDYTNLVTFTIVGGALAAVVYRYTQR